MTDKHTQEMAKQGNMEKDPDDWVTGDEPMTGAQRSYLKTLSEEAKESFDETLTKAEASRRIDELQVRTGRGMPAHAHAHAHAHAPASEPADESALESLGKAISAPVLADDESAPATPGQPPRAAGR